MSDDFVSDAKSEISGMAKDGMRHPSTKPVLLGGAVGAAAGLLLPVLSIPAGLVIGLGVMFYKRVRP
jgi:hypothetical protein